jgi:hypothetical protein
MSRIQVSCLHTRGEERSVYRAQMVRQGGNCVVFSEFADFAGGRRSDFRRGGFAQLDLFLQLTSH